MKTAKTIRVKEGRIEVSEMVHPETPPEFSNFTSNENVLKFRSYEHFMKDFESSFVAVGNPEIFKDSGWMYPDKSDFEYADGDDLKEGFIYPAPIGLVYEIDCRSIHCMDKVECLCVDDTVKDDECPHYDIAICSFLPKEEQQNTFDWYGNPIEGYTLSMNEEPFATVSTQKQAKTIIAKFIELSKLKK